MVTEVAGLVIETDGKFIMVQESNPDCYLKWNLPAGRVEPGETFVQAALREGKEETGYLLKLEYLVGHYEQKSGNGDRRVGQMFSASIVGGEKTLSSEILAVSEFSFLEIEAMNFRGELRADYILQVIKDYNKGRRYPL